MVKKVLIIEDDKALNSRLSEKVSAEGYTVISAFDGESGWERVRSEKPDLIILDVMLPAWTASAYVVWCVTNRRRLISL